MWFYDFHRIYNFLEFLFLFYKWCDTICPDSELNHCRVLNCWVELRCNSSVWQQSCPYKIQSATQRGQAVARCRAGAGHTDITHYYHPQDWNCFAADKLTQADHSIQYSIDQNFKSKMGSWGWQDEGWNTSKALYCKVNKYKNMYGLVYGSVSKLKRTGLWTCMIIIIELWTIQQQPD